MYLGFHFVLAKPDCFFCVIFRFTLFGRKRSLLCKNVNFFWLVCPLLFAS